MGSTRLPGKPLLSLGDRTLVQHVVANMLEVEGAEVVVVTDDRRIAQSAEAAGAAAFVSARPAASGSDRIRNYLEDSRRPWPEVVVNVQGDEPLLEADAVASLLDLLMSRRDVRVATLLRPLAGPPEYADPDVVKGALLPDGRVEDFARLPLEEAPPAEAGIDLECARRHRWHAHVGIYAFRGEAFRAFTDLPPSPRERHEKLEQLRLLEHGIPIHALVRPTRSIAVDTPADLERVRGMLQDPPRAS